MSSVSDFFGGAGGTVRQLFTWQVLGEIISAALGPYLRKLGYDINTQNPNMVLSPQDLATSVVRKVRDTASGAAEALASGIDGQRFQELIHLAGEPPGLETILQLYRRGVVAWGEAGPTKPTVANAIATSRIYTYWSDAIKALNVLPIPPAEMVDALVENQTTRGTRGAAEAVFTGTDNSGVNPDATTFYEAMAASGYTPDQADLMFRTRGNPPAPSELFTLYRRGKIPLTGTGPDAISVQQGIFEGATKDKWWPTITGLIPAIPSLYYVHMLFKTGMLTATVARKLYKESGYTTTVINDLVGQAKAKNVTTYKKLTEAVIVGLFTFGAINATTALTLLAQVGYGKDAARFVVEYVQLKKAGRYITSAVNKVGANYTAHKITTTEARSALARLGIPSTQVDTIIGTWTLEASVVVRVPTEAQIVGSVKYGIVEVTTALARLQQMGYTPYDAWLVLSEGLHTKVGTAPAPGPNPYFAVSGVTGGKP